MWTKMPREFGSVVKDLSPSTDSSKKSLYVITYDDQQRNFNAAAQYYGIFWSEGPDPVNQRAIALWPEFDGYQCQLGDQFKNHLDSEHNIDGAMTKPGECYDGFACFGYGAKAISLGVAQLTVDFPKQLWEVYKTKKKLLNEALLMANRCPGDFDTFMRQWWKDPKNEDLKQRMKNIIGGSDP
jgi:hypothetical protein